MAKQLTEMTNFQLNKKIMHKLFHVKNMFLLFAKKLYFSFNIYLVKSKYEKVKMKSKFLTIQTLTQHLLNIKEITYGHSCDKKVSILLDYNRIFGLF